ncbi:DUF932 domain-containing protein [Nocardiopsis synnemataformans]|uniref:DUF932 domain-containing protein n=1 Tax=Nocardiopsis synnemataformans TaxID=61305 RepID=UPI003EBAB575
MAPGTGLDPDRPRRLHHCPYPPKGRRARCPRVRGRGVEPDPERGAGRLLSALPDESGVHFEAPGSPKDGRHVFITIEIPEAMAIGNGTNDLDLYIAAMNAHDGTASMRAVVCANIQTAALCARRVRPSQSATQMGSLLRSPRRARRCVCPGSTSKSSRSKPKRCCRRACGTSTSPTSTDACS